MRRVGADGARQAADQVILDADEAPGPGEPFGLVPADPEELGEEDLGIEVPPRDPVQVVLVQDGRQVGRLGFCPPVHPEKGRAQGRALLAQREIAQGAGDTECGDPCGLCACQHLGEGGTGRIPNLVRIHLRAPIRPRLDGHRSTGRGDKRALGIQQVCPDRPGADVQGDEQRLRHGYARAASRAAIMRGGKLYVGTEQPGARMNFVFPACARADLAWSWISFADT